MFSPLEQFDIILYIGSYSFIPTVNLLLPMIVFGAVILILWMYLASNLKLIPTVIQCLIENIVKFVFNLIKHKIGRKGYVYLPLILVLFNFILLMNLFSLLPFGLALTSHIIMIFWLSFTICLSIFIIGLILHNLRFLVIFIPQAPIVLLPMLIIIEIFSYIIRAFSLAIRLSANIMAGHTLVHIIAAFVVVIAIKVVYLVFGFSFMFLILALEVGVAFLQAYVFCVLLCIYISDAISGGH